MDFGIWILDFGFWILDFGFWTLDFGFRILDFGFWILDFGFRILDFGFWILDFVALCSNSFCADFGFWSLDFGFRSLDFEFWILDFGFWILDLGIWILDFGFRILDFGFGFSATFWTLHKIRILVTPTRVGGFTFFSTTLSKSKSMTQVKNCSHPVRQDVLTHDITFKSVMAGGRGSATSGYRTAVQVGSDQNSKHRGGDRVA